jgi:hypothetical protein
MSQSTTAPAQQAGPQSTPPAAATGTTSGAPSGSGGTSQTGGGTPNGSETSEELSRVLADLGLSPGQIAERLKASRKWEDRAKAREDYDQVKAELDRIKAASMTDAERARTEAYDNGKAEATAAARNELVAARFEAEALRAGRDDKAAVELLEDLDLSRFMTPDGKPDVERIRKRVEALAPANATTQQGAALWPSTGQGSPTAPVMAPGAAGAAEAERRFGKRTA